MDEWRVEQQVENLHERLHKAAEELEQLRDEASSLAADLRNRLHALTLQRQAVQRLDDDRRKRIEDQSRGQGQRRAA